MNLNSVAGSEVCDCELSKTTVQQMINFSKWIQLYSLIPRKLWCLSTCWNVTERRHFPLTSVVEVSSHQRGAEMDLFQPLLKLVQASLPAGLQPWGSLRFRLCSQVTLWESIRHGVIRARLQGLQLVTLRSLEHNSRPMHRCPSSWSQLDVAGDMSVEYN